MRTLAGLSSRVAAVGAGRLLDVEGPLACQVAKSVSNLFLAHCMASTRFSVVHWRFRLPSLNIEKFANIGPDGWIGKIRGDMRNTDHNDGTECESCCGACRSSKYPWLLRVVSH